MRSDNQGENVFILIVALHVLSDAYRRQTERAEMAKKPWSRLTGWSLMFLAVLARTRASARLP